jgi:predicted nuclease of predicted toxin-antitoxin system
VKFLIDQPLSPAVAVELGRAGHDAVHVRDLGMHAASDEEIFDRAARDDRVVVSADTDFGTLLAIRKQTANPIATAPLGDATAGRLGGSRARRDCIALRAATASALGAVQIL